MWRQFKIIVEKHPDGYVAYPLGLKGIVVGEGDTYEEALADVKSAIQFHIDTFAQKLGLLAPSLQYSRQASVPPINVEVNDHDHSPRTLRSR